MQRVPISIKVPRLAFYNAACVALPGTAQKSSGYKPDVYSHMDLNSGNRWRLEPLIYTRAEIDLIEGN